MVLWIALGGPVNTEAEMINYGTGSGSDLADEAPLGCVSTAQPNASAYTLLSQLVLGALCQGPVAIG
jgi:hypothetical protein